MSEMCFNCGGNLLVKRVKGVSYIRRGRGADYFCSKCAKELSGDDPKMVERSFRGVYRDKADIYEAVNPRENIEKELIYIKPSVLEEKGVDIGEN